MLARGRDRAHCVVCLGWQRVIQFVSNAEIYATSFSHRGRNRGSSWMCGAAGLGPNLGCPTPDEPSPFQLEGVLHGALFPSLALHACGQPWGEPGVCGAWSGGNKTDAGSGRHRAWSRGAPVIQGHCSRWSLLPLALGGKLRQRELNTRQQGVSGVSCS